MFEERPSAPSSLLCVQSPSGLLPFASTFLVSVRLPPESLQPSLSGWSVGPLLDPQVSPEYDLSSPRLLEWILYLVERGLVDAVFLAPPAGAFSLAFSAATSPR